MVLLRQTRKISREMPIFLDLQCLCLAAEIKSSSGSGWKRCAEKVATKKGNVTRARSKSFNFQRKQNDRD